MTQLEIRAPSPSSSDTQPLPVYGLVYNISDGDDNDKTRLRCRGCYALSCKDAPFSQANVAAVAEENTGRALTYVVREHIDAPPATKGAS